MAGSASELTSAASAIGFVTEIPAVVLSIAGSVLQHTSKKNRENGFLTLSILKTMCKIL